MVCGFSNNEILRKQIDIWGRKTFGKQTEEHSPENLDIDKVQKKGSLHKDYRDEDVNQDFLSGLIN